MSVSHKFYLFSHWQYFKFRMTTSPINWSWLVHIVEKTRNCFHKSNIHVCQLHSAHCIPDVRWIHAIRRINNSVPFAIRSNSLVWTVNMTCTDIVNTLKKFDRRRFCILQGKIATHIYNSIITLFRTQQQQNHGIPITQQIAHFINRINNLIRHPMELQFPSNYTKSECMKNYHILKISTPPRLSVSLARKNMPRRTNAIVAATTTTTTADKKKNSISGANQHIYAQSQYHSVLR